MFYVYAGWMILSLCNGLLYASDSSLISAYYRLYIDSKVQGTLEEYKIKDATEVEVKLPQKMDENHKAKVRNAITWLNDSLMKCARDNSEKIDGSHLFSMKRLLEWGAHSNYVSSSGCTPLSAVVRSQGSLRLRHEKIALLVTFGAHADHKDSPYHCAKIIKENCEHGGDIESLLLSAKIVRQLRSSIEKRVGVDIWHAIYNSDYDHFVQSMKKAQQYDIGSSILLGNGDTIFHTAARYATASFWEQLWHSPYCDLDTCSTKNLLGQTASDILYDRGETYWAYNICSTMLCLNKGICHASYNISSAFK